MRDSSPPEATLPTGARRAAGVAGHQEGHFFEPGAAGLRQRLQLDLEAPALHAQALHGLRDGLARRGAACLRALPSALASFR
jgi:hypothetical protein